MMLDRATGSDREETLAPGVVSFSKSRTCWSRFLPRLLLGKDDEMVVFGLSHPPSGLVAAFTL